MRGYARIKVGIVWFLAVVIAMSVIGMIFGYSDSNERLGQIRDPNIHSAPDTWPPNTANVTYRDPSGYRLDRGFPLAFLRSEGAHYSNNYSYVPNYPQFIPVNCVIDISLCAALVAGDIALAAFACRHIRRESI